MAASGRITRYPDVGRTLDRPSPGALSVYFRRFGRIVAESKGRRTPISAQDRNARLLHPILVLVQHTRVVERCGDVRQVGVGIGNGQIAANRQRFLEGLAARGARKSDEPTKHIERMNMAAGAPRTIREAVWISLDSIR